MAYSSEYRKEVLNYIELNPEMSFRDVAKLFRLAPQTVLTWHKTGGVNRLSIRRNHVKVDREQLKAYIKEHPDSYLREIVAALGVKNMGYRRKKRLQE